MNRAIHHAHAPTVNGRSVIKKNEQRLRRLIYQHVRKVPAGQWGDSIFVSVRDASKRRAPRETHGWRNFLKKGGKTI